MTFKLVSAVTADASEIADVHLESMKDNALLHAQFPNPESLEFLRKKLEKDTIEHLGDSDKGALVTRSNAAVASFVKWNVHGCKVNNEEQNAPAEEWPRDLCRREYLNSYGELTAKIREEVMGKDPYYHVTFLCTKPECARQGAASALLRLVQERAELDGMVVVLESTMNAVTFYQRLGFEIAKELSIMIPERESIEPTLRYEEKCMVWRPMESGG